MDWTLITRSIMHKYKIIIMHAYCHALYLVTLNEAFMRACIIIHIPSADDIML